MELITARTLQGLGGALMLPVGRLMIVRAYPRHELISKMSQVVMIGALGVMLGPVLGGFITHYISWHWIFWINIPVGVFAFILICCVLAKDLTQPIYPLDIIGFLLFGLGLAGFTFGLSLLSESTDKVRTACIIMLVSACALIGYIIHSRKKIHPIVNVSLFQFHTFRISVFGNLFGRLGFGAIPFLLPLLLQVGLDYPAQTAGLLVAPIAVGIILIKPYSTYLLRRLGYRKLLTLNTILVAMMLMSFSFINAYTSIYFIIFLTFVYGFLMSMQYSAMNSLAYLELSEEYLSSATSFMSTLQQISQSFGVAIAALIILFFTSSILNHILAPSVFHHAFIAMGCMTLLSALIFTKLKN